MFVLMLFFINFCFIQPYYVSLLYRRIAVNGSCETDYSSGGGPSVKVKDSVSDHCNLSYLKLGHGPVGVLRPTGGCAAVASSGGGSFRCGLGQELYLHG